ncbi:Angiopoietin-like 1 [Operophtera brumata]|uniref:Angiopoietin-like 1 n=1 Tax=Operophtera brumata TaxID=104452 RepID=A0A0L7LCF5_OPEBR|nr:Angiopoietin-like 1 [Operophtera brumata]
MMFPHKTLILLSLFVSFIYGKGNNEFYKKRNRTPTTTAPVIGDSVVEKFVETLITSEKYLKQIDALERKVNHLDANFHEKSNSMLKYLSEMLQLLKSSPTDILEKALTAMKTDLDRLKQTVTTRLHEQPLMRSKLL